MPSEILAGRLADAQEALGNLYDEIVSLNLPPLGPGFSDLATDGIPDALIAHRITSKFFRGDEPPGLADSCIQEVVLNDNPVSNRTGVDWASLEERTRLDLIKAKHEIANLLVRFRLPQTAARFPSGESCITSSGEISFAAKFSNDSQWTVNRGCVEYAARLCYNTASLKKLVKERVRALYPRNYFSTGWGGFDSFYRQFRSVVDIEPARITTVPKNNTSRRVISLESTFAMICQLAVSDGLRNCMEREWGYHIDKRQELHKAMLKWGPEYCTVDLKNASNSNYTTKCRDMWPSRVFKQLMTMRSDVFTYKGREGTVYWAPNMLAPMGNGFTFEVMTITLLGLVRSLDPTGSVYGDDIIIRKEFVARLYNMLDALGWKINHTKTFTDGVFRESCGAFYDHGNKEYILSYDFEPIVDEIDAIVTCNKLYKLLEARQCRETRPMLIKAWARLHGLYHEFRTTPGPELRDDGVFSPYPTELEIHKVKTCISSGLYMRRPRWRRSMVIEEHRSQMDLSEWALVASRKLGNCEKPLSRDKRQVHVMTIDDHTGLTLQKFRQMWSCKVP